MMRDQALKLMKAIARILMGVVKSRWLRAIASPEIRD